MDSNILESHSFGMEETSERGKERISTEDYSESDNCGTSLKHWGDKEPKSSMSYTDVDSAYTSSFKLSSAGLCCPATSVTDSGKELSLDYHLSETSCDEELSDLEETDSHHDLTHIMPEELEPPNDFLAQRDMDFKHIDLTEEEEQKEDGMQKKQMVPEELVPSDEHLTQREMDLIHIDLTEQKEQIEDCTPEMQMVPDELEPSDEHLAQREMDFKHTLFTEEVKEDCTQEKISQPGVSSFKDQRSYFQRNFTIFKEHLEPSSKLMDEIISFECRDRFFPERIREATTRERKADILIKYAARYLDKDSFESLLKKTDHSNLIKKLKKGSAKEARMLIDSVMILKLYKQASEVEDWSHLMCNEQFKNLLIDEIEPRHMIDSLVELEVLSFDDHEDVLLTDFRPTRVESLMKYINRNPERNFNYFFKLLKEHYPYLTEQFDTCDTATGCEISPGFDIKKRTGIWRSPQSPSIDESTDIKFHVRLSPSSTDVEMRVVEDSETNMEVEYNMKLLDLEHESMHLGSIVIVHRQLTCHAIQKLHDACITGEIKKYIKSLFTLKDVEQMKRDGVTFLVLKITAEKSHKVKQKLLKPEKTMREAMCQNKTCLDSVVPGITDTTWMVTGRVLQEYASFLQDELEPKEYVKAFESILPRDVLRRLTADIDRREGVKLILDEIVKKGQQAVDIFIAELERLGRHHVLNILRGSYTNTSGLSSEQIAYQIRTSIVNNYTIFVDELEPKTYGAFFVERRLLDNALYEKICHLPSRRNRAVAFLKWLINEERPDAYIAFQKAVKIFSSDRFVRMLETTESMSATEISSPAADRTNDVACTHVLLYLARFKITFSDDTMLSTQGQQRDIMPDTVTSNESDDRNGVLCALNPSKNETDTHDSVCMYEDKKESGISVDTDLQSYFSAEEHTEHLVARGSDQSRCDSSVSSQGIKPRNVHLGPNNTNPIPSISYMLKVADWLLKQDTADSDACASPSEEYQFIQSSPRSNKCLLDYKTESIITQSRSDAKSSASKESREETMKTVINNTTTDDRNKISSEMDKLIHKFDLRMTEEEQTPVTDDNEHKIKRERDSEPCAKTLRSIHMGQIFLKTRIALWRSEHKKKRSRTDCFSPPAELNMDPYNPKMKEEDEKLVINDILPNCFNTELFPIVSEHKYKINLHKGERDSASRLFFATRNRKVAFNGKDAQLLSEQSKKTCTKDCFPHCEQLNNSYISQNKRLLHHHMETTVAELGGKRQLLTKGKSTFCQYHSKKTKDCYNCLSKSRCECVQCRYGQTRRILIQHTNVNN